MRKHIKIITVFSILAIVTSIFGVFEYLNRFQKPLEKNALAYTTTSKPSLTTQNIGNGACSSTEVFVGMYFDCIFDLIGGTDFSLVYEEIRQGSTIAYIDNQGEDINYGLSENCFISQAKLKCLNLTSTLPNGVNISTPTDFNISVRLGVKPNPVSLANVASNKATITIRPRLEKEFSWTSSSRYIPQNAIGKFSLDSYLPPMIEPNFKIYARVRNMADNSLVSSSSEFLKSTSGLYQTNLSVSQVGDYKIYYCVGVNSTDCVEYPNGQPLEVIASQLDELVPGTTSNTADRINIIFAYSGFEENTLAEIKSYIKDLLNFDGQPILVNQNQEIIYGFFGIEPVKSNRDKFNVWIIPQSLKAGQATEHSIPFLKESFAKSYSTIVTINDKRVNDNPLEMTGWTDVLMSDGGGVGSTLSKNSLQFGNVWKPTEYNYYDSSIGHVIAHELSHALFGLPDENENPPTYPSCAPDMQTAQTWWGDLVGQVDPFYYTWRQGIIDNNLQEKSNAYIITTEDDIRIGYNTVGCGNGSIKPNTRSLMNYSVVPVYGSVSRRRVQQVLDLFTGTTTTATALTSADIPSLTVVCDSAPVNSLTSCNFTLPSNKTLPYDFSLKIGVTNNNGVALSIPQSCTETSGIVTCTNTPTGNSVGNITIFGQFIGATGSKTATSSTVAIKGVNFAKVDWVFNPDQGSSSPLFKSQDNTSITVKNLRTVFYLSPSDDTQYVCTFEYRNLNDRLMTTPVWTPINTSPVPYITGNGANAGCKVNLTKAQRGNMLNQSLRVTITDTSITTPTSSNPNTYIFYNEYVFRFQGSGLASGE